MRPGRIFGQALLTSILNPKGAGSVLIGLGVRLVFTQPS